MSTSTEITRIQTARNTIRDKLIDLGLALSADTLDKLATAIAGIVNNGAVSAEVKTVPERSSAWQVAATMCFRRRRSLRQKASRALRRTPVNTACRP